MPHKQLQTVLTTNLHLKNKNTLHISDRLGKNHYIVNSEILGIPMWRKKRRNYDKFEIATNSKNQIFNSCALFFFPLTDAT